MRIALLHSTYEPHRGGVDLLVSQHAALFAARGHSVSVVCGAGGGDRADVRVIIVPELCTSHPLVQAVQRELVAGVFANNGPKGEGCSFFQLARRFFAHALAQTLGSAEAVFAHDLLTSGENPAAAAELRELAERQPQTRFVAWAHQRANDRARDAQAVGLHARSPRFTYVAASARLCRQIDEMDGPEGAQCIEAPCGVEPADSLNLSQPVARLAEDFSLLERDVVLLHPGAVAREERIEFGLQVALSLKERRLTCAYLVTAAPDFRDERAVAYAEAARHSRNKLGLGRDALFLHDFFTVSRHDLISLYAIADAVFLPAARDKAGPALLEAALQRVPIFAAAAAPLVSHEPSDAVWFDCDAEPAAVASQISQCVERSPAMRSRKRVLREHSWARLYGQHLAPLLREGLPQRAGRSIPSLSAAPVS